MATRIIDITSDNIKIFNLILEILTKITSEITMEFTREDNDNNIRIPGKIKIHAINQNQTIIILVKLYSHCFNKFIVGLTKYQIRLNLNGLHYFMKDKRNDASHERFRPKKKYIKDDDVLNIFVNSNDSKKIIFNKENETHSNMCELQDMSLQKTSTMKNTNKISEEGIKNLHI